MSLELFSLKGKTALVTGGSQGIGLMISKGLVEAGARVYVCSRKAELCDAIAKELSQIGDCQSLPGDVSKESEIARIAAELQRKEGKLHILVNNAGAAWGAPLTNYPDSAWDKVLQLNVKTVFHLSIALLPLFEKVSSSEDPGRIINIGSIDGFRVPSIDNFAYSTSKAAVHHLTRVLAQQLAPQHITVNAVAPGPFPSKMMAATLEVKGDEFKQKCPLGRLGEPDDMAGICTFLSSRASSYITGQIIAVDGGFSTSPW